jgi:Fe-S-cluster containining protein
VSGCNGACCVAFPISCTLEELRERDTIEDQVDLLAMLVPLTHEEAADRRARFGVELPVRDEDPAYFRCVHWDETTRLCGNYENRPGMCRWYPYEQRCEHGCDCDAGRPPRLWQGDQA